MNGRVEISKPSISAESKIYKDCENGQSRPPHGLGCMLVGMGIAEGKKHGTEMVAFLQKYNYLFTWGMRHPPQNRYLQNEQNIKQKDIAQICGHESHKFLSLYFGLCSHACPICPPSLINEAHLKSGRP